MSCSEVLSSFSSFLVFLGLTVVYGKALVEWARGILKESLLSGGMGKKELFFKVFLLLYARELEFIIVFHSTLDQESRHFLGFRNEN